MAIVAQLLETHEFARLNAEQREFLDRAISAELLKDRALVSRLRRKAPEMLSAALKKK